MKIIEKSSINEWIDVASKAKAPKGSIANAICKIASFPRRRRVVVNLKKLNASTKENEIIVVPGKVLGVGTLDHKLKLAAIEYSGSAVSKLNAAGCELLNIDAVLKEKSARLII